MRSVYLDQWWFPALVAAVVLLGATTVLIPQSTRIIESVENLKVMNQDLEKAEKKIAQVDRIDSLEIGVYDSLFTKALPKQKPYFEVMVLLQQLAMQTGVVVGDFELNPGQLGSGSAQMTEQDNAGYVQLETKLNLTGNSEQLSNFLVKLHNATPLLIVDEISISNDAANDATSQRGAQIALKILYSQETNKVNAVGLEPLSALSKDVATIRDTLANYYDPNSEPTSVNTIIRDSSRTNIFEF